MNSKYLKPALDIGFGLLSKARELPDGSLWWNRGADRLRRPVIDSGPVSGRCGEALFLAALARVSGERAFAQAALKALIGTGSGGPAQRGDRGPSRDWNQILERLHLGAAGVGGMIYAWVAVGRLMDCQRLVDDARIMSRFLTPERIGTAESLDLMSGLAGAILGLLALVETEDGCPTALERAELCGRRLLDARQSDEKSGLRAWATSHEEPSAGFAHGAAGIAHALLCLYRHTGQECYLNAALEAFAFERVLFQPATGQWSARRHQPTGSTQFVSWCQGAPGIGLSRLSALETLASPPEPAVVQDLHLALQSTARAYLPNVDTLCCGYFGRIDILLEAGARLGNESLIRQARRLADLRLQRAETEGFHEAMSPRPTPLLGGFWQGEAGIGYVLLRLAEPKSTPCVLALS